jgi:hypothetical protein
MRSTLEKQNVLEEGQKRGCCGSTELAIVVARRSWREISLWKTGDRHKKKKRSNKERKAGKLSSDASAVAADRALYQRLRSLER